ncbi:MAG TPA: aminotransferase class III-fold pyridoxal phosphate-dependent enzyme [Actinobacteria bacterium]|nr:aminotransferase class III-fold pyridoxal phosphate-dependent enzyme [Actinomycetota bacterium]
MEHPHVDSPPPGAESRVLLAEAARLMHRSFGPDQSVPFVLDHKEGWFLHDVDGNAYIDLVTGWGSTPLGARHPDVEAAVVEGWRRYTLENTDYVPATPLIDLARRLVELAPAGLRRVAYEVSGTEAVETALKLMREATGRPFVIAFHGQYHGESYIGQSLSAQRSDFTPRMRHLTPGVLHVPFPHPFRCPFRHGPEGCDGTCVVDYIEHHLTFHVVAPDEIAGVFMEPILGEGGVLVPPDPFWPALEDLCRRNDWLLCLDEVETCFGRTGTMFAAEHWDLEPDLMCLAKALSGGGLPIAAVLMTEEVAEAAEAVNTGGTWAGQPAAALGTLAALEVYERDRILDHVRTLASVAEEVLRPLEALDIVGEVRIKGLYLAVDFVADGRSLRRAPHLATAVHRRCVEAGVVGIEDGVSHYRALPALNMPVELFTEAMRTIAEATVAVDAEARSRR